MKQHLHISWESQTKQTFVLNLDNGFSPFANEENLFFLKHKSMTFHGGEPHFQIDMLGIDLPTNRPRLIITQRYNKIHDLMMIVLAVDAARRVGFEDIELILPYFPAARQDRVCNEGEPLTIKIFTDLINGCEFKKVFILTPHSEVTAALLNNVVVLDELDYVERAVQIACPRKDDSTINIVCPDAGAGKRVGKVVTHLANKFRHNTVNLIRCEKVRDVRDGSLKEFFVQADDLGGHPTLIVDDINSMGGTFIGLGKKLREKNCGRLMLFTAHADCVEGIQNVIAHFDHYYTTDSKQTWDKYTYTFDGRFTCFRIKL